MDDFVKDFLVETVEMLAVMDNDLVRLETAPEDTTLVAGIFRTMHTIKGTCGFLGLAQLGRVAHAGESVLDQLRDGTAQPTPEVISAILSCVDVIKEIVAAIETTGREGVRDDSSLLEQLDALSRTESPAPRGADQENDLVPPGVCAAPPGPDDMASSPGQSSFAGHPAAPAPAGDPPARPEPSAHERRGGVEHRADAVTAREPSETPREPSVAQQTIRVGIDLLEGLMTTVSELVLTRNQLLQLLRNEKDSGFAAPLQHLSRLTSELQESVMKTRMQPIGNAWSTLPRIVRDLARELGKQVELVTDGADTELDRQVLELIKDPLTHMVRNASDHGLESTSERLAAGKAACGRIRLNAFQEGGHIIIQISDDGRGLDVARIRQKAVQSGLVSDVDAAGMSDAQVFRFILRPGFSTAAAVTSVSGRGVGMDVVSANVAKIGGTIDVSSVLGRGATFTIKIPLTLAIVSALIVGCAGERFAIPQLAVVELVRAATSGERRIEQINDIAVLRLRDRLLPLIDLRGMLGLTDVPVTDEEQLVIVTQAGAGCFGIVVDCIYDTEEIVVKPVSPVLKSLGVYSGNTILGDGSVCMIIDPNGLLARIDHLQMSDSKAAEKQVAAETRESGDQVRLLLVRAGSDIRKAIPLDLITRIEDIDVVDIRQSSGRMLVPYRNHLMPLVPAAHGVVPRTTGKQPILVFSSETVPTADGGHLDRRPRMIGLVVDEVIDIIESIVNIEISYDRPDITGSAMIGGEPTDVMNISYHLQHIDSPHGPLPHEAGGSVAALDAAPHHEKVVL
jgi:two-component system chemotaxis sensor kinase CheA